MSREMKPNWWIVACVMGALGVALGAFGAHGLKRVISDPDLLAIWETGARYHLMHALALGLVAAHPNRPRVAGWLFTVGIVVFAGSLYALVLSDVRALGAITPFGGLSLIAGWIALALSSRGLTTERSVDRKGSSG